MASVAALSILTAKRSSEKEESFLFLFYRDWSLSNLYLLSLVFTLHSNSVETERWDSGNPHLNLGIFLDNIFSQNETITLFSLLVHTFSVITCHLLLFLNLR